MESNAERGKLVQEYLRTLNLQQGKSDFEFLSDMIGRHVATFAFSNVGVRLGEDLPLDFESLFNRIVVQRRGGYCFEQNGLFYEVIEELGYKPKLYLARVIYNQESHPGLTHRISIMVYEGQKYVVDVGFGPQGPRVPVPMYKNETKDEDRVFRVKEIRPGEYHMQILREDDFFSLYRFELARYGQSDCELGHFYSHRHPNAVFVNHLVVSRLLPGEIRSLRDLEYWVIAGLKKQVTQIGNPQQLRLILVEELGIQITEKEGGYLFDRLCV